MDRLKIDGEVEDENEEEAAAQVVKEYKVLRELEDPGCFVLPIRLEGDLTYYALADTGSNINMMPYKIYEFLERGKVKPKIDKIRMLDMSQAETMGRLLDVLCHVSTHTILENFLLLDVPIDKEVPLVVGRSFIHTLGSVLDTRKKRLTTFDGVVHHHFETAKVRRNKECESDSEDEEEFLPKRDENGKPIYGPIRPKYYDYEDPMERVLAEQEYLNPFRNVCVWKKVTALLGSLPLSIKHIDWTPNYFGGVTKGEGDRKWHVNIKIVDPYGNGYEKGFETKHTKRKPSGSYKLSDIMSPDHFTA